MGDVQASYFINAGSWILGIQPKIIQPSSHTHVNRETETYNTIIVTEVWDASETNK